MLWGLAVQVSTVSLPFTAKQAYCGSFITEGHRLVIVSRVCHFELAKCFSRLFPVRGIVCEGIVCSGLET